MLAAFLGTLAVGAGGDNASSLAARTPAGSSSPATAAAAARVTPLKFIPANSNGTHLRRHPVPHKRRLSPAGLELEGNLNTLGYFSADVCVGTPSKLFDLIIDTGSALTAFPCSDCPHCGAHQHSKTPGSRFDISKSSTASKVDCARPPAGMHCRSCDAGGCAYGVSYTEGSSIRGRMVSDLFHFGSEIGPVDVQASFGCQTYESGLFYSQVADGISGFSQSSSYGPTLFDYLHRGKATPDVFSMCLSEKVGGMVLGGTVPQSVSASSQYWVPYTGGGSYVVPLVDIKIAGKTVNAIAARYGATIVDSGTTFMYLPPDAYRPVVDHFRNHCPWGACASRQAKGEYPDDFCYTASLSEVDRMDKMTLHFNNGVVVDFGPRQYAYELRAGVYCLGVFNNEHNGAVIGAANMRNHEVVFDREHKRIAFVPSDCGSMHAGTRASVLTGGYSLNGCAAAVKDAAKANTSPPPPSASPSPPPKPSPPPPNPSPSPPPPTPSPPSPSPPPPTPSPPPPSPPSPSPPPPSPAPSPSTPSTSPSPSPSPLPPPPTPAAPKVNATAGGP